MPLRGKIRRTPFIGMDIVLRTCKLWERLFRTAEGCQFREALGSLGDSIVGNLRLVKVLSGWKSTISEENIDGSMMGKPSREMENGDNATESEKMLCTHQLGS